MSVNLKKRRGPNSSCPVNTENMTNMVTYMQYSDEVVQEINKSRSEKCRYNIYNMFMSDELRLNTRRKRGEVKIREVA